MTKRENFVAMREVLVGLEGTESMVAFVDTQVELLDRRAGAERKPTAAQLENVALKDAIVGILDETEAGMTATDIGVAIGVSVQKASQLLRQLVLDETVTRVEGKGKEKTLFIAG